MTVDGVTLLYHLIRTKWNCHINLSKFPLHPCTSVEPYMAVIQPICILKLIQCFKYCLSTYSVCTMRVSEITCKIYLVWLNLLEKFDYYIYVCLSPLPFLDASGLIEWKIEEMSIGLIVKTEGTHCTLCFCTSDCTFQCEKGPWLRLARFLRCNDLLDFFETITESKLSCSIHMLQNDIIMYRNITGCFICNMDIVSLFYKTDECTSH